jgi:putative Mn2+ efflux pump MntP
MGARLGLRFTRSAEFVGGAVLIGIGTRILIEHLSGAA